MQAQNPVICSPRKSRFVSLAFFSQSLRNSVLVWLFHVNSFSNLSDLFAMISLRITIMANAAVMKVRTIKIVFKITDYAGGKLFDQ